MFPRNSNKVEILRDRSFELGGWVNRRGTEGRYVRTLAIGGIVVQFPDGKEQWFPSTDIQVHWN